MPAVPTAAAAATAAPQQAAAGSSGGGAAPSGPGKRRRGPGNDSDLECSDGEVDPVDAAVDQAADAAREYAYDDASEEDDPADSASSGEQAEEEEVEEGEEDERGQAPGADEGVEVELAGLATCGRSPLLEPGLAFDALRGNHYDPMHTIAGISKDVIRLLSGDRFTGPIRKYEDYVNDRDWGGEQPWKLGAADKQSLGGAVSCLARAIPAREGGGSRIGHLMNPAKKKRMHTWAKLASPYGTYLLACCTEMGEQQRHAMQAILRAASFIQDKAVALDALPAMQERVVRAICLMELALPVTECDIKLHNLIHLVDRIRDLGPSWTTAMWGYESQWGVLKRMMKKRDTPEKTAIYKFMDAEVAMVLKLASPASFAMSGPIVDPGDPAGEPCGFNYVPELNTWVQLALGGQSVPSVNGVRMKSSAASDKVIRAAPSLVNDLLMMYVRGSPGFDLLWAEFKEWLRSQWPEPGKGEPSVHTRLDPGSGVPTAIGRVVHIHKRRRGGPDVIEIKPAYLEAAVNIFSGAVAWSFYNGNLQNKVTGVRWAFTAALAAVDVGPVRFFAPRTPMGRDPCGAGKGYDSESWFLTRRCRAHGEEPWFGRIKGIFRHDGPAGPVVVLDAQWYGRVKVDGAVMGVSFAAEPSPTPGHRCWFAQDVAPVRIRALPHPTDAGRLVALSDSFNFMRAGGWGAEYVSMQ